MSKYIFNIHIFTVTKVPSSAESYSVTIMKNVSLWLKIP